MNDITVTSSAILDKSIKVMKMINHIIGADAVRIAFFMYLANGTSAARVRMSERPDKTLASLRDIHNGK
jgi:hypothetical protein